MAVQRTFIDEKYGKITVKIKARSYMGNFCGYHVFINDAKFMINTLDARDAETIALQRWRSLMADLARIEGSTSDKLEVIRDDKDKEIMAHRGEQLFRYLYKTGQWQKLMGVSWVHVDEQELFAS